MEHINENKHRKLDNRRLFLKFIGNSFSGVCCVLLCLAAIFIHIVNKREGPALLTDQILSGCLKSEFSEKRMSKRASDSSKYYLKHPDGAPLNPAATVHRQNRV